MDVKSDILKPYTECEKNKPYYVDAEKLNDVIVGNNFKFWIKERKGANSDEWGYTEATSGEELW